MIFVSQNNVKGENMPFIVSSISLDISSRDIDAINKAISVSGVSLSDVVNSCIVKKSIDARKNNSIRFVYTVALELSIDEKKIVQRYVRDSK